MLGLCLCRTPNKVVDAFLHVVAAKIYRGSCTKNLQTLPLAQKICEPTTAEDWESVLGSNTRGLPILLLCLVSLLLATV